MNIQTAVIGANALFSLLHGAFHAWTARRKPTPTPTITKETTMEPTTPTADAWDFKDAVETYAAKAFMLLEHVGSDWAAIKNSDAYKAIKPLIISAVTAELGAPAASSLTNLDFTVERELDALAGASQKVATP